MIDKFTLGGNQLQLTCLEPGWCDYKTKTIHLDHVSAVSFTISWDCPAHANSKRVLQNSDPDPFFLSVHTSTAGMTYDSVPVSLESQGAF